VAALAAPAYAFAATFALLKLIGRVSPLRVNAREEALGMDIVSHGEEAYATGEGTILVEPIGGPGAPERALPEPAVAPATS
jgi:Amt family ammonium transporter